MLSELVFTETTSVVSCLGCVVYEIFVFFIFINGLFIIWYIFI